MGEMLSPDKELESSTEMSRQDSMSSTERPQLVNRPSSIHSISQVSPSATVPSPSHRASAFKSHRAHTAGRGHLQHARNTSYGKNMNKLGKLTETKKPKSQTPSTSPSNHPPKRDSSNVSLPRVGSKASVKRNSSNLSLLRNASTVQIGKQTRPVTPLRRSQPQNGNFDHEAATKSASFTVGSANGADEEWTEASNSQSPTMARQSSITKGLQESKELLSDSETPSAQIKLPVSPPKSPGSRKSSRPPSASSSEQQLETSPQEEIQYTPNRLPRPLDHDAITSRLLNRKTSYNVPPTVSSISAVGTPGIHTPPILQNQGFSNHEPSMPENGVSRFLNGAGGSSGSSNPGLVAHVQTALNAQHPTRPSRTRSPSPEASLDAVRRAKSAGNLNSAPALDSPSGNSPPSYTILPQPKRPGGNTQAKLDLWRSRTHAEPSAGSPVPLTSGFPTINIGMSVIQDKRSRLWEGAEGEMGHLRRFRNPVLEGVGRALKKGKKGRDKGKDKDNETARKNVDSAGVVTGTSAEQRFRGKNLERIKRSESRPGSVADERVKGVRFDVTERDEDDVDAGDDGGDSSEIDTLQALLRRMWEAPSMETVVER
ncbi:hypothetical protein MMC14_009475 [Varicellaria rhodocarpa]|nr:hypothetical protein [Varicellaria rhodocarpa]